MIKNEWSGESRLSSQPISFVKIGFGEASEHTCRLLIIKNLRRQAKELHEEERPMTMITKLLLLTFQISLLVLTDCFILLPKQSAVSYSRLAYSSGDNSETRLDLISSPTLKEVYPRLVQWKQEHGHPNIPLSEEGGRQCQMVRQLYAQQNKLTVVEVELLERLGFEFHLSEKQLYWNTDFDVMLQRLSTTDSSADPELEAWITGVRILGKDNIRPEHALLLAYHGFSWEEEKEDSSFMDRYREIRENAKFYGRAYLQDPEIQRWIRKQEALREQGLLSDSEYNYLLKLSGKNNPKLTP